MKKQYATFSIELIVKCPQCDKYFDLTEEDEWWTGLDNIPGENKDLDWEIACSDCGEEFIVDHTS